MTGFCCTKRLQDLRVSISFVVGALGRDDDGLQCQTPRGLGGLRFDSTHLHLCLIWVAALPAILQTSRVQEELRIHSLSSVSHHTDRLGCLHHNQPLPFVLATPESRDQVQDDRAYIRCNRSRWLTRESLRHVSAPAILSF
jgi:hypothetical protein